MAKKKEAIHYNSYDNPRFSAMWPRPFMYKGQIFKSVEHFYQWRKLHKSEAALRAKILNSFDPYKAKHFGSKKAGGKTTADWDTKKLDVMKIAIRESYMQNPNDLQVLLDTKDMDLIHDAEWDDFWGVNKAGKGGNNHGILLMKFRDEMKGADVWKVCKAHQIKY